jgi:tRNA-dihydrouridine synthase B
MFEVGKINIEKALLLAPMEDVTDPSFRRLCREFGADIVYTEFVNSDGLIRNNRKTHDKLRIYDSERPIGIQIYGGNLEPMVEAAKIAELENPEIIDINAGCWVKKVANRGAGAGLLKDPPYMQKMVEEIVKSVELPVTVKTRIGWDRDSIEIIDVARRIEDAGAKAITIHCRTRNDGHSGEPDWEWISRVKECVEFPVILNGGVFTPEDVLNAFRTTKADGVMIARGAIGNPWIFAQAKELLNEGKINTSPSPENIIETIIKHLRYLLEFNDSPRALIPFRKFYAGYLKGLYNSSKVRQKIYLSEDFDEIVDILYSYLEDLDRHTELENSY